MPFEIRQVLVLLALTGFLLGSVPLIRLATGTTILHSPSSFRDLRISGEMGLSDGQGRGQFSSIYHLLLGKIIDIKAREAVGVVLNIILGLALVLGLALTLEAWGTTPHIALTAAWLLLLSPGFLYYFAQFGPEPLGLTALVWGAYFAKRKCFWGWLLFGVAALSGPVYLLASIVLVWVLKLIREWGAGLITLFGILTGLGLWGDSLNPTISSMPSLLNGLVLEFGGMGGVGLAVALLTLVGSLGMVKFRVASGGYALLGVALLWAAFFGHSALILSAAAWISAPVLMRIALEGWRGSGTKIAVAVLLLASLTLSTALSMVVNVQAIPNRDEARGIRMLSQIEPQGAVLSHPIYAEAIMALTRRFAPTGDAQLALRSTKLEEAKRILLEGGISHILITPRMKSGLVWGRDDEGLLFLLRNNESFARIWRDNGVEIWEVRRGNGDSQSI